MIALAHWRLPAAIAAWCAMLGVGGCGQKGALYLPDPVPQAVPAPAAVPPATPTPDDEATRRKTPRIPDPATAQ